MAQHNHLVYPNKSTQAALALALIAPAFAASVLGFVGAVFDAIPLKHLTYIALIPLAVAVLLFCCRYAWLKEFMERGMRSLILRLTVWANADITEFEVLRRSGMGHMGVRVARPLRERHVRRKRRRREMGWATGWDDRRLTYEEYITENKSEELTPVLEFRGEMLCTLI